MESVGRLAGGVAHDFNNLLTSILGNVELILESVNPADPIHAPLTDVQRAGQSAASLTRQLLAFSRKQIIAPKLLNLNALLADMERMLKRIIGEDVALETRAYPALPCVCADAGQLEQIVVNLAVNARDAMPAGGHLVLETAEVAVDDECCARHVGTRPGPYVRLAVRDTGSGMDADTKAHLFEPFFTTKPQGTGLGLATVYGAVSQNGGFIEVDSETGQGTVVRIYLPAVSGAAEATVAGPVAAARGLETILLVEDEPLVRELARRALVARGYGVIAHASGRDAIEAAARFAGTIELLVTDVVLPGINGRELATQLALTRPGLRTLFTSGYTDDIIGHHGVLEPGVSFLPKPYTPQALAEKVRSVLDAERES
jgi:CheY-like chemotaxis protein